MGVQRLSHLGICVSDLERSLRFYRDGLGFRTVSELRVSGSAADRLLELQGTELEALYLERDGARIELLHYVQPGEHGSKQPRPMNQLGLTHLSFRIDDLEATLLALRALGAQVLEHTRIHNPQFHTTAIFVTDPDGTRLELLEQPGDSDTLPGSAPSRSQ